ncbi:MAG TPA: PIG-L family deacetylase [Firmicutes bacterium]|nr:PIG-L family deacetylase [Candidatus Fermentithermobacillaceae bacterium]
MDLKDLIPIPDLLEAKDVLVIFPHPDDAELTAGGTVALLTAKGARVSYCSATDGSMGCFDPAMTREKVAAIRREEQVKAAETLGVKDIHWLGFTDGFLPDIETVRRKIVAVIRKVKPDFIITLDPWLTYEAHPDHRKTAMAAVEAAMYAPFPLAYPEDIREGQEPHAVSGIAFAVSSHPNTVVDITETWERKIAACLCHKSQFPEHVWNSVYAPVLMAKSREIGQRIGAAFGEDFKVMTMSHLHIFADAWRV